MKNLKLKEENITLAKYSGTYYGHSLVIQTSYSLTPPSPPCWPSCGTFTFL